jgi:hypothetical protein
VSIRGMPSHSCCVYSHPVANPSRLFHKRRLGGSSALPTGRNVQTPFGIKPCMQNFNMRNPFFLLRSH